MSTQSDIETMFADKPPILEQLVAEWLVSELKAYSEMPADFRARVAEGLSSSEIGAACVRVYTAGTTGDEDTADRNRHAVIVKVVTLFDYKAFSFDSFRACVGIVQRAIFALDTDISFSDTDDGENTFYWACNSTDLDTDVIFQSDPYFETAAGKQYNHAEFSFILHFRREPEVITESVWPVPQ